MDKIKNAVFNTGPFIHLKEINCLKLLNLFEKIIISNEVFEEYDSETKNEIKKHKNIFIINLNSKTKDLSKYLIEQYNIHLGEATSIALSKQENIKLFFTDDLDAREIAKLSGIEVHGTLAIITRSLKENIIDKKETIKIIKDLHENSSLYITKDLINWILEKINKYKQ